MDCAGTAPLGSATGRVASPANDGLRRGLLGADGRPDRAAVKDAFEALLLGELLKPLQESLTESGLFPAGAQGDIYAHLWQTQLSELLAADLDLLPGWTPGEEGPQRSSGEASAEALPAVSLSRHGQSFRAPADEAGAPPANAGGLLERAAAAAARVRAAATATLVSQARGTGRVGVHTPATSAHATPARAAQRAAARTALPAHLTPVAASSGTGHALAARLAPFEPAIQDAAHATGVEANWLRAVIIQESAGRPDAVSRKGAAGLMQLLPSTAAALGVTNPFEPAQNIMAGARYLRSLLDRYGDPRLALAAYNAGPGRVETYGGIPPFRETRRYVEGVLALKGTFDRIASAVAGR